MGPVWARRAHPESGRTATVTDVSLILQFGASGRVAVLWHVLQTTLFWMLEQPGQSEFQVRKPPLLPGSVARQRPAISRTFPAARLSFRCPNHCLQSVFRSPKQAIIYVVTFAFALLTRGSQRPGCNWIQQSYSLTCHINSHPSKMRPKGAFGEVLRRPV